MVAQESAACRALLLAKLDEATINEVTSQRHSRNAHIQQALMQLLPRLAAFNRERLVAAEQLSSLMSYLLGLALRGRDKERSQAFVCLGLMALALAGDEALLRPYLPRFWELVRAGLPSRETPSKKRTAEPALFACVSLLGHACGQSAAHELRDLVDPMLATGLSSVLTTCLRELAATVPSLKPDISQGLLRMLSQVIAIFQLIVLLFHFICNRVAKSFSYRILRCCDNK